MVISVSQEPAASIIREADQTLITIHQITKHHILIFIFTAIRTSDLTWDRDATHVIEATNAY
jgi:hypothetical protein